MTAFNNLSGKITSSAFKELLLPKTGHQRDEVLVGPNFGVDNSVIDLGNNLGMAISSDPLSLIPTIGTKASAWMSVHLLANDMATTGFSPMYAQFVLNLPSNISLSTFKEYWNYIHFYCKEIGVSITGGHTGRLEGQNSVISGGGTMFLTAPLDRIITSNGAKPGDVIIVTKESALNSSSILAMSFPETIKKNLGLKVYQQACENFYHTSSLKEALLAAELLESNFELNAMHDVTEGGVLGAIYEMAYASNCGFEVYNNSIPTGDSQTKIMDLFEIDHRFCIGAGAMIMSVKKGNEKCLINHLESNSIKATVVGEFTINEHRIIENGIDKEFVFDGIDPYWQAYFKAVKDGIK
ncbi:AIR synthase [Brumimicrobium glaciale]|uniref:AIR synthase n=1 Tax=Brumimicrobium glaciale TaxID=200475 RepID=A0A4Q4KJP9_9FLAO|nr:AIR synthase-related protein [Brumimicrobium glaciale]RYM33070.1 AIR synthase [Brumimicrobium glaciale]